MKNDFLLKLLSLLMLSFCSFHPKKISKKNLIPKMTFASKSSLLGSDQSSSSREKIFILSTNDFHGHYDPVKTNPFMGGFDVIRQYFEIAKKTNPQTLILDSGHLLPSSPQESGKVSPEIFLKNIQYDALSFGAQDFISPYQHDFHTNPEERFFQLKQFSAQNISPIILSNFVELKTGRLIDWNGVRSHLIKRVGSIDIGLIGILSEEFNHIVSPEKRIGFYVEDMVLATIKHARTLRDLGAKIIIVLTNQHLSCSTHGLVAIVNDQSQCDFSQHLGKYLNRLPPQLVDVVLIGNKLSKITKTPDSGLQAISLVYQNMFIMNAFPYGLGFNFLELHYDQKKGMVDFSQSKIHGPILFCKKFDHNQSCLQINQQTSNKNLFPAYFLDVAIK